MDERIRLLERAAKAGDVQAKARLRQEKARAGTIIEVDEGHRVPLPAGVDPEKALIVSSSQLDAFDSCERKWWFTWPIKMPEAKGDHFSFGTTLHEVCERYLRADDLGRDLATGEPVNLYPEGWNANVTNADADLIQRLVAEGIQSGLLERRAGREVELKFLRELATVGEISVFLTGAIDLLLVDDAEVQDHKTTKSTKYIKSPAALARTTQMRTYAYELLRQREEQGLPQVDSVKVRHNVYIKDPAKPGVTKREAIVTREAAEQRHAETVKSAERMVAHKQRFTSPSDWHRLPEPTSRNACMAYGGCPYLTVCGGRETPQEYATRIERVLARKQNNSGGTMSTVMATKLNNAKKAAPKAQPAPQVNGETPDAGSPDDADTGPGEPANDTGFWLAVKVDGKVETRSATGAAIRAGLANGTVSLKQNGLPKSAPAGTKWASLESLGFLEPEVAPPAPEEEPAPPVDEEPAPPEEEPEPTPEPAKPAAKAPAKPKVIVAGVPPWHYANCTACKNPGPAGFSSNGNPCRICDDMQIKAGKPSSNDYDITTHGDGRVTWAPKAGQVAVTAPATKGSAPLPNGDKPVTQRKAQAAAAPAPASQPEAAPAEPTGGKKGGRPTTTFRLYINCGPVGDKVVDLSEILATYGKKLAEESSVASFYDLDAFQRRDSLAAHAEQIAADLKGQEIVARPTTPDLRSLCDALRGLASKVIESYAA